MIPSLRARDPGAPAAETLTVKLRKVLIVDEALPVRRALLDAFHKLGIPAADIVVVRTPEEAMEQFVRLNPTLVCAEFVGEGDEGLRMIEEMLSLDPRVRIVLATAEPLESPAVRRAIRMGAFAHVEKPLRHEKIRQVVSEIENETGGIERFR
jgi:DNA-binding NtrC family response regulator